MHRLINPIANLLALVGIALVVLSGMWRLSGTYSVMGVGTIAFMQAGIAAMVAACLGKLELLLHTSRGH